VNVPKWRILKDEIGDGDVGGGHELQQVRSGEWQRAPLPHIPPHAALAINGAILTCTILSRGSSGHMSKKVEPLRCSCYAGQQVEPVMKTS
jgi:hypothetical protein